jgi:cation diffusion facilitator family transporter
MTASPLDEFHHEHVFLGAHHDRNERKTWSVILLCTVMMAAEIGGGAVFHSMALVADGLHMSTHAGALLIAAAAYTYARRHAHDPRFTFGTGKLGDLAAFSSAIVLAMIALLIGYESLQRLFHPVRIAFNEAIPIAVIGLGVNLLSAWLLKDDHDHDHGGAHGHGDHGKPRHHVERQHEEHDHDHGHDHEHEHGHDHGHRDLNLRAAYVHVLADAAVSVLAIVGLIAGKTLGWIWMDAVMGLAGALVIANWSWGLVRAAGSILLDMRPGDPLVNAIRKRLEVGDDRIADLHVWQIGPGHHAAAVSILCPQPEHAQVYRQRLAGVAGLSHVTVEIVEDSPSGRPQ